MRWALPVARKHTETGQLGQSNAVNDHQVRRMGEYGQAVVHCAPAHVPQINYGRMVLECAFAKWRHKLAAAAPGQPPADPHAPYYPDAWPKYWECKALPASKQPAMHICALPQAACCTYMPCAVRLSVCLVLHGRRDCTPERTIESVLILMMQAPARGYRTSQHTAWRHSTRALIAPRGASFQAALSWPTSPCTPSPLTCSVPCPAVPCPAPPQSCAPARTARAGGGCCRTSTGARGSQGRSPAGWETWCCGARWPRPRRPSAPSYCCPRRCGVRGVGCGDGTDGGGGVRSPGCRAA